ncbi:uncharacterized protein LOC129717193 [Wyeomyia smithii]|uniref:uncharacterized protein LOC129717193 n=1 Tax=Wyeomyia smithii TaxID=174621 RepID=UPI002467D3AB|nr:uncharacterized protein LOC129717193 [Wyeomyia smithii]
MKMGADLSTQELQKGERSIWRIVQSEVYPDDVAILTQNSQSNATKLKRLKNSSALSKLTPVIDEFGVLRVDTRIKACEYATFDSIYPIILPRDHRITYLVLGWYHRQFKHANDETVINEVRQKFHIPQLRVEVRQTRKRCMWCRVKKPVRIQPRMGQLPKARLTPFQRAFTYVGIDYFGPYHVKVGRATAKRWVALFTCLTTRAIHLELVGSLTTDCCKKAIRRFIACRGPPAEIYSDRGTNFVGVSKELEAEIASMNKGISNTFTDTITKWKFNPPASPHMGSCWERMVRSVKTALGALPDERKLDDESLETLLKETQHMINSRPLTIVPLETAEQEALTPNHFLLLNSSGAKQPEKEPTDAN